MKTHSQNNDFASRDGGKIGRLNRALGLALGLDKRDRSAQSSRLGQANRSIQVNQSNPAEKRRKNYGQGMTEYIVIVALIAIASIAAISFFGNAVQASFGGLANVLGGGNADNGRASATTAGNNAVADSKKKHSLTDFDK